MRGEYEKQRNRYKKTIRNFIREIFSKLQKLTREDDIFVFYYKNTAKEKICANLVQSVLSVFHGIIPKVTDISYLCKNSC